MGSYVSGWSYFFLCLPSPWPHKTGSDGRKKKKKIIIIIIKCILMYNQGNMRLHVDLFIKYVYNSGQFYIDITNNCQRKLLIKLKNILSSIY